MQITWMLEVGSPVLGILELLMIILRTLQFDFYQLKKTLD